MNLNEALELVESIKNRCDAIQSVKTAMPVLDAVRVFHTLFEDIYEDAQELVEFCVVKE